MKHLSAIREASDEAPAPEVASALRLNPKVLPFRVCIVRNEDQLKSAVDIRAEAYHRRWPESSEDLVRPEPQDRDPNSLVFLAVNKSNNETVGTMRIETNLVSDLPMLEEARIPDHVRNRTLAYMTRLGVKGGSAGSMVKLLMFKAAYRYCFAKQISQVLVGVHPPTDRDYIRMGFLDIHPQGETVQIGRPPNVPLRMMAIDVVTAERRWREEGNPIYAFMCLDFHPDIEVFSSVSGMWTKPRRTAPQLFGDVPVFDEAGVLLI